MRGFTWVNSYTIGFHPKSLKFLDTTHNYCYKVTSSLVVVLNLRLHNYYDREIVCTEHIITLSTPLSTYKFSRLILYIHLFIYLLSFANSWQCHRNGVLSGANYQRPVTVPSPMRDWLTHRGTLPYSLRTVHGFLTSHSNVQRKSCPIAWG